MRFIENSRVSTEIQCCSAFTLAEVLITLAIIGIVAALTLPALTHNTQEKEFHTAWKKSFSNLSQATKLIVQDKGGNLTNVCTDTYIHQCARDWFADHLSVQKKCSLGIDEGCWPNDAHAQNGSDFTKNSAALVLNNGTLITFLSYPVDCSYNNGRISDPHYICTRIFVDVNGLKKPNVVGKDIYEAELTSNNLLPSGNQYDWNHSAIGADCSSDATGESCSAYYLYN